MANVTMGTCPSRSVAVHGAEMRFALKSSCWRWRYCRPLVGEEMMAESQQTLRFCSKGNFLMQQNSIAFQKK